jgi:hypothetical protein
LSSYAVETVCCGLWRWISRSIKPAAQARHARMSSADRTGRSARIESTVTPVAGTAGCRAAVVLGQPLRVFFHAGNPQNRDNHDAGVSPIMAENFTSGDRRRPGTGNFIYSSGNSRANFTIASRSQLSIQWSRGIHALCSLAFP